MKKVFIAFFVIVLVIIGFILYYFSHVKERTISDAEKKNALSKLLGRNPVLKEQKVSSKWISYNGNYIQFSYPEIADIHKNGKLPPLLENFQFGIRAPVVNISIQVVDVPQAHEIADYPAVTLRQIQKDNYKQADTVLGSKKGIEFIKIKDGIEESSFFFYKGKIYSIVGSGYDKSDVDKLYRRVLATIKFN